MTLIILSCVAPGYNERGYNSMNKNKEIDLPSLNMITVKSDSHDFSRSLSAPAWL